MDMTAKLNEVSADISTAPFVAPFQVEATPVASLEYEDDDLAHGDIDPDGCWNCDSYPTWCSFCNEWTRTCCEDYGTCACS